MNCASCGTPIPSNGLFCPGCGQRVTVQRRTAVATAARPAPRPALPREELDAAIATRRELGERLEPEVVDTFLDRVEHAIDARVDARLSERLRGAVRRRGGDGGAVPIAVCSLIFGIPITAIAAGTVGLPGLITAWAGIAIVNLAYNNRKTD